MKTDNRFDPITGLLDGDHLVHLSGIGIHKLIDRVNFSMAAYERQLTERDLPGKVLALVGQATRLTEQLLRCEAVHVSMAPDFVIAQARVASNALPLIQAELERRETAARDAVAAVRQAWMGKASGPVAAAVVERLLAETHAAEVAAVEAQVAAWRHALSIARDSATGKSLPRWLVVLTAAHQTHTIKASVG
jgi:hypothetical protein